MPNEQVGQRNVTSVDDVKSSMALSSVSGESCSKTNMRCNTQLTPLHPIGLRLIALAATSKCNAVRQQYKGINGERMSQFNGSKLRTQQFDVIRFAEKFTPPKSHDGEK